MKSFKKWMVVPYEEDHLEDHKTKDQNMLSKILENKYIDNSEKLNIYNETFKKLLTKKIDKEEVIDSTEKNDNDQLINVQNTINKILEKINQNNNLTPIAKRTRIGLTNKANKLSPNIKSVLEKQIKNSIKEKDEEKVREEEKYRKELFKTKKSIRTNKKNENIKQKKKIEIIRNINMTPEKTTVSSELGEYNWEHDNNIMDMSHIGI
jgi:hypothetical protein